MITANPCQKSMRMLYPKAGVRASSGISTARQWRILDRAPVAESPLRASGATLSTSVASGATAMKNKNNVLDRDRLAATDLEDRIGAEQVRAAYSNTSVGMSATAVAALLVSGILAGGRAR